MPRRVDPENLRILKKHELKVDIGPCRQTIEFLSERESNEMVKTGWFIIHFVFASMPSASTSS